MRLTADGILGLSSIQRSGPDTLRQCLGLDQSADVTSKSVPQGEKLGFKVSTNMYSALI